MLVVNDIRKVGSNTFQEDGPNVIIDIRISEGGDIFEVIYHPCNRDPFYLIADDFSIRTSLIGFAAENTNIVASSVQGLRQAIGVGFHATVGRGRIPICDE